MGYAGGAMSESSMSESNGQSERILCVRELRWYGNKLQQKLLISANGVESEEWRTIPQCQSQPVGVAPRNLPRCRTIKWTELDWSKSDYDLAKEHGYSIGYIYRQRQQHGVMLPRKPRLPQSNHSAIVSNEQIEAADWPNNTDVMLSVEWGISRERVRQLRIAHSKPACRFKSLNQDMVILQKWFHDHREEIEGKHVHEIIRMPPGDATTSMRLRAFNYTGIKSERNQRWKRRPPEKPYNLLLPNLWLAQIWKLQRKTIALHRSNTLAGKATWHSGGFGTEYLDDSGFLEAIKLEVSKAVAHGVSVSEEEVLNAIRQKKDTNLALQKSKRMEIQSK